MSHNHFYSTLRDQRDTKSAMSRTRSVHSAKPNTVINYQKREKLKQLLITKFMKKYNLKTREPFIEEEVKNFLHKETLTDNDLQRLDKKIYELLSKKHSLQSLEKSLREGEYDMDQIDQQAQNMMPDITQNRAQTAYDPEKMSVRSGLSGASKLSQACKNRKHDLTDEELEYMSVISNREQVERINFGNEKDEWDAINKYNQKKFIEQKMEDKQKDKEVKRRTKEDLDNQIKQKMLLQNEERLKNREYDKITIDHVKVLNKLEEEKQKAIRDKKLREKENRDAQRMDEAKRKRIEELKNRKYEKNLIKYINDEIKTDKENALKKKMEENEALKRVLAENEENKKLQALQREKEKLEDIRSMEEYSKVLDKQENERKLYFANIEGKASNFLARISETVLKDVEKRRKEENERIRKYEQEKEEKLIAKDKAKMEQIRQQKLEMRNFLNKQMEEKRKKNEFEKYLDMEQGRIWNTDREVIKEQMADINGKVRIFKMIF